MSSAAADASPSLERRLNRGVGLGLTLLLILGGTLICLTVDGLAERALLDRLRHDLDTVIAAVATPGPPPEGRLTLVYRQAYSGHYFRVAAPGQVMRSRSLWDADFQVPALAPGAAWSGRRPGPEHQRLLVLAQGVVGPEGPLVVAVAEDVAPLDAALRRLVTGIALFGLLTLVILLRVQRRLIRRGLAPLLRLRAELQQLERGERRVLSTAGVPGEVLPLVERLNGLLALLATRLERSRKALGNLAHALKTPLTALIQTADDLADQPVGPALSTQVNALRGVVDRELRRARLAGAGLPAGFDLGEALASLLDTLGRIYRDKHLALTLDCPPGARFAGDREDLLELMGVLLDNACKWARRRVRVRVGGVGELTLEIDDDGPGIPAPERPRLLRRGQRLDEGQPGAGLGLGIAGDVVDQYDGEMTLEDSPLGGLAVRLRLPGEGGAGG